MPTGLDELGRKGNRVSVMRAGSLDALTPGALAGVVVASGEPSAEDWDAACRVGAMVVRARPPGEGPAWTAAAWESWEFRAAALTAEAVRRGARLLLWAHADDVVSDVPGLVRFFRSGAQTAGADSSTWSMLADPAALFTGAMVPNARDHLGRYIDALTDHDALRGRVAGVVLRDMTPEGGFGPMRAGGVLTAELVLCWRGGLGALSRDLIFVGDDPASQAALLQGTG